jgi:polyisoprenoid-binding protein YceI
MNYRIAVTLLATLVSACAPLPPPEAVERPAPADFPEAYYRQAAAQGKAVYRIDPSQSVIVIEVRRGGSLARFGHDHVVANHDVIGYAAPDEGRADLYVQLDRLVVDEPALRSEAGFQTQPSESDIAGTRRNMLEKVLDAQQFPFALVHVKTMDLAIKQLDISITLHGTTRALTIPVQIENDSRAIAASGRFELNQTDFGITPFSILGGAIKVQDRLVLQFRIRALRLD